MQYFKQAQLQRPRDPLVRDGLLLAQDILKARQQKEQEDKARAMRSLYHGLAGLLMGDVTTAGDSIERAEGVDPTNNTINAWSQMMYGLSSRYKEGQSLAEKRALVNLSGTLCSVSQLVTSTLRLRY